ncbi:AraC family transcriptional regulator [Alkalihalobacillus hemicellulosilyticus]|uniref:Transcriptional regulator n=1 Tax=Halalkalibacter hemicellulosilyticusJCM 9152 TaxID=1236971 RepID=W4QM53_9BACI|nr:AraC family transcriptional regulator [Halalkalibacter hemicellulosilyticus]GAE32962.1 transcriptional regulator [Halalkalibacter hemicellulosilyticusJCM 9152]
MNKQISIGYCQNNKVDIPFHSHPQYEIFYFHGGRCNYLIGDRIYVLKPGDVILMNGMTLHRPKLFESADYIRTTIHFDRHYIEQILSSMNMPGLLEPFTSLPSIRFHLKKSERAEVEEQLQKINQFSSRSDSLSQFQVDVHVLELLALLYPLCKQYLRKAPLINSQKENHVQRVISFVEEHYMEHLELEQIEEELHVSKYYLANLFKEVTGITIFNYVKQRRVNQAKIQLMLEKNISVTELAYQLGFKYPSHFSKVFKHLTGVTPEQYRKSML